MLDRKLVFTCLMLIANAFIGFESCGQDDKTKFTPQQIEFFESKVRPLLVKHCYECHGPKSDFEGSLNLASRKGLLEGGDSGPAIDLKEPEKSIFLDAINYGKLFEMPPSSKLGEADRKIFTRWIKEGAPWPNEKVETIAKSKKFDLKKRIEEHWSWKVAGNHQPPKTSNQNWSRQPFDRFILAGLDQEKLQPAKEADRRTWIRRVTFDLIGLAPTRKEINDFLSDKSPQAYEKVVDRLLASPHFGERWARHWMDLIRYAETCGHEFDYPIPHAHQYRDYLIRAFNQDVPYNQLVVEHLAGDLLKNPRRNIKEKYNESILGTGFWFLGEATHGPVDSKGDEAGRIDNQIDVMSKTFLGLTIACARCHDHKFDAISIRDYYSIAGFLQSSRRQEAMIDKNNLISAAEKRARGYLESAKNDLKAIQQTIASGFDNADNAKYLHAAILYSSANRTWLEKNNLHYQGEALKILKKTGGDTLVQKLKPQRGYRWEDNKQIWWFNGKEGDELTLEFDVNTSGKYRIEGNFTKAIDYGKAEILIDGKSAKEIDFYHSALATTGRIQIAERDLEAGKHKLTFRLTGTNQKSNPKYMVGLDFLHVRRIGKSAAETGRLTVESLCKKHSLDATRLQKWIAILGDQAIQSVDHPLFGVQQVIAKGKFDKASLLQIKKSIEDRQKLAADSRKNAFKFADFKDGAKGWFRTGHAFDLQAVSTAHEYNMNSAGKMALPGTLNSGRIGKRFYGVMRSPTFEIKHPHIHYRMKAENIQVRVIVDGFVMDIYNSLLFNGLNFKHSSNGEYRWRTQGGDLRNHIGKRAHIEIIDHGNGFASLDEIWFSKGRSPAESPSALTTKVWDEFDGQSIESFCQLVTASMNSTLTNAKADLRDRSQLFELLIKHEFATDSKVRTNQAKFISVSSSEPTGTAWERLNDVQAKLVENNKNAPRPIFAVAIADGSGEDENVFVRGNHKNLGPKVRRRMITALGGEQWPELKTSEGSGRLLLAQKIANADNPLTARVMVNRLWHHMFGRGIVKSVDNFGVLGAKPTHPKMLDFLAKQFVADDWSIKKTLKRIALSSTYRMSSKADPAATKVDPDNKYYHSMRIKRLQGEAIRDSMLQISGQLDRKLFGPSVPVHLTPFMQGRGRPGKSGPLDGARRRSIYTETRRNFLPPMMLAFDTPVPFNSIGRRNVSNVPAQALILMNDPFVLLQAEKWSEKILSEKQSLEKRIHSIYETAFGRPPNEIEIAKSKKFLQTQAAAYRVDKSKILEDKRVWKDFCHVMFNVKEFIFIR